MKEKPERLKPLSAQGMSFDELIRCVLSADPRPLWEQEKEERKNKEKKRSKKKNSAT